MAKTVVTKSGQRLTEADIERLADEAERGFDLSTWRHKRGRRPLGDRGRQGHSPRLAVRIPEELRREATEQAAKEGRTISQVVRQLLAGYVREGLGAKPR